MLLWSIEPLIFETKGKCSTTRANPVRITHAALNYCVLTNLRLNLHMCILNSLAINYFCHISCINEHYRT